MKRIMVVVTLLIFVCTLNMFSLPSVILVYKYNGGPQGFNSVTETHYYDRSCECMWHELTCRDPGYTACEWTTPPEKVKLVSYAEEQINKGVLNGYYEQVID